MKQKAYRQNPTVIDLSKKARPPPGETTLIYMNCLIIWILLTMPMRPSGLFGRAHFVRSSVNIIKLPSETVNETVADGSMYRYLIRYLRESQGV